MKNSLRGEIRTTAPSSHEFLGLSDFSLHTVWLNQGPAPKSSKRSLLQVITGRGKRSQGGKEETSTS